MIQANELRIGNWVQCDIWDNGNLSYLKVKAITEDSIFVKNHTGNFGGFEGVPLTPKILKAAGFETTPFENTFIYKSYMYDREATRLCFDDDTSIGDYDIEYLHQLQNLYFALTGKELEVNL